jgi:hypothetical protein
MVPLWEIGGRTPGFDVNRKPVPLLATLYVVVASTDWQ